MKMSPHFRKMFRNHFFGSSLLSIYPQVVESFTSKSHHFRFRYNVEPKFGVYQTSSGLWHVTLIWNKTTSSKTTWATHFVHPLGPFGIQTSIRFFIFGFEHSNNLAFYVFHEIWARATLVNSCRVNACFDGDFCLTHNFCEFRIVWKRKTIYWNISQKFREINCLIKNFTLIKLIWRKKVAVNFMCSR